MSRRLNRLSYPVILAHRQTQLQHAFDLVLAGKVLPDYITFRAKKLKQMQHNKKL